MSPEPAVGSMTGKVEPSTNILLHSVVVQQIAAEGQSDKMASDMKVHVKQISLNCTSWIKWHPLTFTDAC